MPRLSVRKKLSALDQRLFDGFLKAAAAPFSARLNLQKARSSTDHCIQIYYRGLSTSELARLCDLYGSDKGTLHFEGHTYPWPAHTYADFYEMLFGHCRTKIQRVLECGIGTNNPEIPSNMGIHGRPGASLRVWRDYFPNAEIVGVDIDSGVMFSEDRIRTYRVDQTCSESISKFLVQCGSEKFDIIIDDGLHEFYAGICLFENMASRLAASGVYLIEDVAPKDAAQYTRYFSRYYERYAVRMVNLYRPRIPLDNNSIVMITPCAHIRV